MMKRRFLCLLTALLAVCLLLLTVACASPEVPDTDDTSPGPVGPAGPAVTEAETTAEQQTHETTAPAVSYAPDFEVLDKDGNTVKLSDFRGKPVVVNFWATWCPPCKAELPDFDEAAATYGDQVTFLMVNLTDGIRDTVSGVKTFVTDNGYTFPVYFDTTYSAANAYRVSSIPTTYFINAAGEIVGSKVGMISAVELESYIKLLTE